MLNNTKPIHKIILFAVFTIVAILGLLVIITPSAIFPDASWGFHVLRSMQMGGGFNILTKPDQQNIALNSTEFISWWSPGQYLVPYLFQSIIWVKYGAGCCCYYGPLPVSGPYRLLPVL
jgi:hypothetical protein